jgi:hypothetical protein
MPTILSSQDSRRHTEYFDHAGFWGALGFFVDWTFDLANAPVFTIQRHTKVYRRVTSLQVCTNLFSFILAYMSIAMINDQSL